MQDDVNSYDILNGGKSNNSINMININDEEEEEEALVVDEDSKQQTEPASTNSKATLKTANRNPMSPVSTTKSVAHRPKTKTPLQRVNEDAVSEKTAEDGPDHSIEKM